MSIVNCRSSVISPVNCRNPNVNLANCRLPVINLVNCRISTVVGLADPLPDPTFLPANAASIWFEQYDGPFVYPVCSFYFNGVYYKTQTASGQHRLKYAPVAGSVHLRTCSLTEDPPAYGLQTTEISGSVTRDADCNETGLITVNTFSEGSLGAYFTPFNITGSGNSINAAYQDAFGSDFVGFFSGAYQEFIDLGAKTATLRWSSPEAPGGFFPGSLGGIFDSTYCQGYTTEIIYSNPVTPADLSLVIAREGGENSPAQTQYIESFDLGSRTEQGSISRAIINVNVDSTRDQLTGEFVFLVTPTVGDPYEIQLILDFPISSPVVTATITFPRIVGATVEMTSWIYSYQKSVFDDFESYSIANTLIELPSVSSWNAIARLNAPSPNTDCWDSFEEFPLLTGALTTLITGQRWAAQARMSNSSRIDCYDDFESYSIGVIESLTSGLGWSAAGHTRIVDYAFAYDDFESYIVGAITLLDFTSTDNKWADDGHTG